MAQNVSQQQEQSPLPDDRITVGMWVKTAVVIVLVPALVLFGAAGTFSWPMAWLYLALSALFFAVSRYLAWRSHPDVLRERGRMMDHDDTADFDRVLVPLLAFVGPVLIMLVAGFALRFDWAPVIPRWAKWAGVALFVLGYYIGSWALIANRFFSGVVRIQTERGHHVVNKGPYAIVRHPGYLGAGLSYIGLVLMLGSPWGLIPLVFELAALIARTALEDRLLQAELTGYAEYAQKTGYRLLPGIW